MTDVVNAMLKKCSSSISTKSRICVVYLFSRRGKQFVPGGEWCGFFRKQRVIKIELVTHLEIFVKFRCRSGRK